MVNGEKIDIKYGNFEVISEIQMEISEEEKIQLIAYQKIASIPHETNDYFSLTHEIFTRIPLKEVKKLIGELQVFFINYFILSFYIILYYFLFFIIYFLYHEKSYLNHC